MLFYSHYFFHVSYNDFILPGGDESNLIVYSSPSKKFHDIVLQSHKGLPRFGALNDYTVPKKIIKAIRASIPVYGKIRLQGKKIKKYNWVFKTILNW